MTVGPVIVESSVLVRCECGELHTFERVHDEAQYTQPCRCGLTVSLQLGPIILESHRRQRTASP